MTYTPGRTYAARITYAWLGSPAPDYTVKVYSKHSLSILDPSGEDSIWHADGTEPSELTGNPYDYNNMPTDIYSGNAEGTGHHPDYRATYITTKYIPSLSALF